MELDHNHYMTAAYQEALRAYDDGEVPVGAVVVSQGGTVLGRGSNSMERLKDATAHAEILAIGAAGQKMASWRLNGCVLYVTLEPCLMCLGAIIASRLDSIVYGARDPRLGAVCTHEYRKTAENAYHTYPHIIEGIMAAECGSLLTSFFKDLRKKRGIAHFNGLM